MKTPFILLLLLVSLLHAEKDFAEVTERTPQQIAKVEEFIYTLTKDLFKKPKMEYLKKEFKAPWKQEAPFSKRSYKLALNYLSKHASISLVDGVFGRKRVIFDSEFPKNMTDLQDQFLLKLISTNIKNSKKKRISFNTTGMTKWNTRTIAGSSAGETFSDKWQTLRVEFQSSERPGRKLTGDLTFNAQFATGYESVKLSKKSKGKRFTLGGQSYKVISVKHNKIVLETKNRDLESFDFVNLHSSGKAYVRMTFGEHQIRGGRIKPLAYRKVARKRIQLVDKVIYKAITKKPKMKFKKFKQKFHKYINNAIKNDKLDSNVFLVLESAAPINNFYIYTPNYSEQKKIVHKGITE
jgi:hypothetical protein